MREISKMGIAFCMIACVACSKKNNTTPNSTQAATVTPAGQNSFNGDLQFSASQTLVNSKTGQFSWQLYDAIATFYNGTRIQVASVLLDSVVLPYNTTGQYYYNTNVNHDSLPHWQVNGLQNIPSFSYTAKMPTCLNWNTFPDTIDHTKAFSLFIKYDVADEISPSIYTGGPVAFTNFGFFNTDTATFSCPASTMNTYVGNAQLRIRTDYTDKVLINGVSMWFFSEITFIKNIYIK